MFNWWRNCLAHLLLWAQVWVGITITARWIAITRYNIHSNRHIVFCKFHNVCRCIKIPPMKAKWQKQERQTQSETFDLKGNIYQIANNQSFNRHFSPKSPKMGWKLRQRPQNSPRTQSTSANFTHELLQESNFSMKWIPTVFHEWNLRIPTVAHVWSWWIQCDSNIISSTYPCQSVSHSVRNLHSQIFTLLVSVLIIYFPSQIQRNIVWCYARPS